MIYEISSGPSGIVRWQFESAERAARAVSQMVGGQPVMLRPVNTRVINVIPDGWCYLYNGWTPEMPIAEIRIKATH